MSRPEDPSPPGAPGPAGEPDGAAGAAGAAGAGSLDGSGGGGPGNVRPTGPGPLVVLGVLAMVLGWSVRPLSIRFDVAEPVISAWTVVVLWVLAAGVGFVAFRTWRMLQRGDTRRGRLAPYQAVNRLVLGKAAAIAGAVVLGAYAGFAIAHLGIPATELSGQRLLRSLVAALGGLGLLISGLLLERACRVPPDDDGSVH